MVTCIGFVLWLIESRGHFIGNCASSCQTVCFGNCYFPKQHKTQLAFFWRWANLCDLDWIDFESQSMCFQEVWSQFNESNFSSRFMKDKWDLQMVLSCFNFSRAGIILKCDTIKENESLVYNILFGVFNINHLSISNATFLSKPHVNRTSGYRDTNNSLNSKTL